MGPVRKGGPYREVAAMVLTGGLVELLVAWMHAEIDSDLPYIVENYAPGWPATSPRRSTASPPNVS